MKSYIVSVLIGAALGCLFGVSVYKTLRPAQTSAAAMVQDATSTHTILRYETKEGRPVVKETMVVEKKTSLRVLPPPAIERRKNLVGVQSVVSGAGILVGPQLGREIFNNVVVTGGVLFNTQGQPKAVTVGVLISF